MNSKQEILIQAEALERMNGPVLELIALYAKEFREIINDFEREFGRVPSADDLLWCASEHAGHDIRKGLK